MYIDLYIYIHLPSCTMNFGAHQGTRNLTSNYLEISALSFDLKGISNSSDKLEVILYIMLLHNNLPLGLNRKHKQVFYDTCKHQTHQTCLSQPIETNPHYQFGSTPRLVDDQFQSGWLIQGCNTTVPNVCPVFRGILQCQFLEMFIYQYIQYDEWISMFVCEAVDHVFLNSPRCRAMNLTERRSPSTSSASRKSSKARGNYRYIMLYPSQARLKLVFYVQLKQLTVA